jgi:hypothetical protein
MLLQDRPAVLWEVIFDVALPVYCYINGLQPSSAVHPLVSEHVTASLSPVVHLIILNLFLYLLLCLQPDQRCIK